DAVELLGIARVQDEARAGGEEAAGEVEADAARGAGHDHAGDAGCHGMGSFLGSTVRSVFRTTKWYFPMDSINDGSTLTYDQLTAFLAVAGEGSFTEASAKLHKSQPAVSKLVRNLEEEVGLELFDRRQYRATLTDAGRRFYERAASVIERTEE